ncbi:MAG: SDR family oxidoreductase [Acidobacteriota bacterium]|nr:SDR family oxidoreductase [Acidobacteriota bacterium]
MSKSGMLLSGKTAIVTGGTGALGSAIVRVFLDEGARVAVPFRKAGELEALRGGLPADAAGSLSGAMLDLLDETAVLAFAESVAEDRGGLDILVNTAGAFAGGRPVHETPWSLWQSQLDANLKTAVLASRAAVPQMLRRGGGAIVNVSSRPATGSGKDVAAYAASKRALLQLTDAMAAELAEAKITVNAILPSTIDTPANRKAMPRADSSRWVKPEEIARVVLFLAGPDSRIVSGAHLPAYGAS